MTFLPKLSQEQYASLEREKTLKSLKKLPNIPLEVLTIDLEKTRREMRNAESKTDLISTMCYVGQKWEYTTRINVLKEIIGLKKQIDEAKTPKGRKIIINDYLQNYMAGKSIVGSRYSLSGFLPKQLQS